MGREIGRDRCLGKREMVEIKSVHQEKQNVPANEKLCNFFSFFSLFLNIIKTTITTVCYRGNFFSVGTSLPFLRM